MAERTNLISQNNSKKYIFGSIFLIILAIGGIVWLSQEKKVETEVVEQESEEISATPTEIIEEIKETNKTTGTVTIVPTKKVVTPTTEVKKIESFKSETDLFEVLYSGKRKLYQDNEGSGRRYTFYDYNGNITVHVGANWSWVYPERVYDDKLLVDGQKTFIYEISNQKIIDFEKNNKKYTIQCVHNGKTEIKNECQKFVEDFKFI